MNISWRPTFTELKNPWRTSRFFFENFFTTYPRMEYTFKKFCCIARIHFHHDGCLTFQLLPVHFFKCGLPPPRRIKWQMLKYKIDVIKEVFRKSIETDSHKNSPEIFQYSSSILVVSLEHVQITAVKSLPVTVRRNKFNFIWFRPKHKF